MVQDRHHEGAPNSRVDVGEPTWNQRLIDADGIITVAFSEAEGCAEAIYSNGYVLLGFEGFVVADGIVEPNMNFIADFSRQPPAIEEALAIIRAAPKELTDVEMVFTTGGDSITG